MGGFCWKIGHAYCGFGEVEDTKPGLITGPNSVDEWEDEAVAAEAREYRKHSSKIRKMESNIAENAQRRQERRQRLTVFAKQVEATECPKSYSKTNKDRTFLNRVLCEDRKFIFVDFTAQERGFMLDVFQKDDTVKRGEILYSVGDIGDQFFVIEKGKVDLLEGHSTGGDISVKTLGNGDSFGEVALIFDAPRTATARAKTDCVIWRLYQHCFRAKLAHHALSQEDEMIGLLRRVELFADMDDATLRKLANALELVHFKTDERIVNKGDIGQIFYIVQNGQVRMHEIGGGDSQHSELIVNAGEWFGERALLTGEPRYSHATALTDVDAWAVDRETFESSFGPLREVIEHQMKLKFLKAIPVFSESDLHPYEFDQLAEKLQELSFKAGHHFDKVGEKYRQELIIIRHGRINVYDGQGEDGGKVFSMKNGSYYGDKHMKDNPPKPSVYNVVCEENTTVWSMSRDDILNIIGSFERLGKSVAFQIQRRVSKFSKSRIKQSDIVKLLVLGHGGFGKVWLVRHKITGDHYALKELHKRKIIDKKQTKNVLREKEILSSLNHPFILGEVSSFQDEQCLYILMDLVRGGELYSLIVNTNGKGLPKSDAVFYGACIHCALSHFHARLIAYRDVKPENIMIGADGYCVLVDLGFAKVVTTKTFTLCGTPEYLAPEVLMSQGHNKSADLWSFGVMIYELTTGRSAFYRPGQTRVEMFKRIVRVNYELPPFTDPSAADLIKQLLERNPAKRLGNRSNGSQDICDHPWFETLDWKLLRKKEIKAPWIPEIKEGSAVTDTHLDATDGAYRDLSLGKPLSREEQSIFKSF